MTALFMKKLITILLIALLIFTFAACGGSETPDNDSTETDMSAYPDQIRAWTSEDFIEYFKAQGILPVDSEYVPGVGNHADYFGGTPIDESVIWSFTEDDPGSFYILILNGELGDCSDEEFAYWMDFMDQNKSFPYDYAVLGEFDHLVDNVVFIYSSMNTDEDLVSKEEAAYQQFIKDTGFTPAY